MRIFLILIGFMFFSSVDVYSQQQWTLEEPVTATAYFVASVGTKIQNNKLLVNYCFVYNQGRKINCMDGNLKRGNFVTLNRDKGNNNCFSSDSIPSLWVVGKTFPLSICFVKDDLLWKSSDPAPYIPKKVKLIKEN